jgi:hypothetical protein
MERRHQIGQSYLAVAHVEMLMADSCNTLTLTTLNRRCNRCMFNSKVATSANKDSNTKWCKHGVMVVAEMFRPIRIWPLFIIKDQHQGPAIKQSLEMQRVERIEAAPSGWKTSFKIIKTHSCNSTYRWHRDTMCLNKNSFHRVCPRNHRVPWRNLFSEISVLQDASAYPFLLLKKEHY